MSEQLKMQREDYEQALKEGRLYVCNACNALTISDCEDVTSGECFYCGAKDVTSDKTKVKAALDKCIKEGTL